MRMIIISVCLILSVIIAGHLQAQVTWTGCGVARGAFMSELARAYESETGVKIELSGGGDLKGIKDVSGKTADMGGVCRHTLDRPEEQNIVLLPIALDAIVVITHKDNPVDNISLDQLKKVFSGEITQWSQLGAPDGFGKINLHTRPGKITGVGIMTRILAFLDPDMDFASTVIHKSTMPLEDAITKDPLGIGVSGIASTIRNKKLKLLEIDNIAPTRETILDTSYPLIRPLYLIVHKDRKDEAPIAAFLEFAFSEKGQQAIAATGTVPIMQVSLDLLNRFWETMEIANQKIDNLGK